jgi:hypothetical protein
VLKLPLVGIYIFVFKWRPLTEVEVVLQACLAEVKRRWRRKVHMGREESKEGDPRREVGFGAGSTERGRIGDGSTERGRIGDGSTERGRIGEGSTYLRMVSIGS